MAITQFDKVELLLPMTGANNGTVFTDYSLRQRTVTRVGSPVISTAQSAFAAYESSLLVNSDTQYLSVPMADGFKFGSGDFTIECWAYLSSVDATNGNALFASSATSGNRQVECYVGGNRSVSIIASQNGSTLIEGVSAASALPLTAWRHLAFVRDGGTLRVFVGGTQVATESISGSLHAAPTSVFVGNLPVNPNAGWNGHINDLCVTKGVAKYTVNFTPPARMTQRELTRTNTGTDSHEYDRAVLFDWNAPGRSVVTAEVPDVSGDFAAADLIDLEYGVAFLKADYAPICRGPYAVDADA